MNRLSPIFALAAAWTSVASVQAEPPASPWYPALIDAAWHYRVGETKLVIRVATLELQGKDLCARLETSESDAVIAVQHVSQTAAGILRVSHNGEKVGPNLMFLKLPPAKGQSWEVDSKIESRSGTETIKGKFTVDEDDVKVPAGEFRKINRVKGDVKINDKPVTITSWYAERFGMVKQTVSVDGQEYVLELEKFEEGK